MSLLLNQEVEIAVAVDVGKLRPGGVEAAQEGEIEGSTGGVGDGKRAYD